ncbi:hypothetical protein LF1_53100 [Rubripirellula obstinata]|uniref:Uncharacterized protein n=1 Tax=Rubripirellula obstinata TaxID=406547 RepID=A0A5B1CB72_9BACT|nr:hypothetical protein LF1_53100 [Rubripirellula obstinata]
MTKRKKRILRFSLRSLLGLTFVAGAYFALGPPTRSYGVPAVSSAIESEFGSPGNPAYVAPLLLEYWQMKATGRQSVQVKRHYYVWLPGFACKLGTRVTDDTFTPTRRADDILADCLLADWPPSR